ncbi:MAG: hypothetical protein HYX60_03545 [Legionella longbeachae]|nr:hypothetical protein [Legionella longbeachae]
MLVTLALVVLLGSIFVFFSDEFIKTFKKLFAIKGAKLFIPLLAASWFVYTFDFWCLWAIFYLREILRAVFVFVVSIIPVQPGATSIVLVILLTVLSVAPVWIMDALSRRKTYKGYKYPYITSGVIWIVCVVLLIVI